MTSKMAVGMFVFVAVVLPITSSEKSRIISVKQGDVEGNVFKFSDGHNEHSIEAYEGIPYASPPIGSLRFLPPVTNTKWKGILKATHKRSSCPQQIPDISNKSKALALMSEAKFNYLSKYASMLKDWSEDCLYLNVYVPSK